jgi:hypothetical protein
LLLLLLLLKLLLSVGLLSLEHVGLPLDRLKDVARFDELGVVFGDASLLHLLVFLWPSCQYLCNSYAPELSIVPYLEQLPNMLLGHTRRQYIAAAALLRHALVGLYGGHVVVLLLLEPFSIYPVRDNVE